MSKRDHLFLLCYSVVRLLRRIPSLLKARCGNDHSRAADEEKSDEEEEHVSGLMGGLRLRYDGVGKGDLCFSVLVGVVLVAVLAVPVFRVALFGFGSSRSLGVLHCIVAGGVYFTVLISAVSANRLLSASSLSAGAV